MEQSELFFSREILADLIGELQPLLLAHKEEVSLLPDVPLHPDWPTYLIMERNGAVRVYTARDSKFRALVGYAIFFVHRHIHYNILCADQDVLYLSPERRKGFTAKRMIEFSEKQLGAEGVQVVTQHSKKIKDLTGLLSFMGYEHMDTIFYKRLNNGV